MRVHHIWIWGCLVYSPSVQFFLVTLKSYSKVNYFSSVLVWLHDLCPCSVISEKQFSISLDAGQGKYGLVLWLQLPVWKDQAWSLNQQQEWQVGKSTCLPTWHKQEVRTQGWGVREGCEQFWKNDIVYRQSGGEKVSWSGVSSWIGVETARKQHLLLWIGCEQQIGKFMCKQEAESPGILWGLASLSFVQPEK